MRRQVVRQAAAEPVNQRLMTVPGIGPLTATAYVATIDDPWQPSMIRTASG